MKLEINAGAGSNRSRPALNRGKKQQKTGKIRTAERSMPPSFTPRLDILPAPQRRAPQRRLWDELDSTPDYFTLYGGTALALHLGHRQSIDFDFFSDCDIDPAKLAAAVPYLKDAQTVQREKNTLSVIVNRGGDVKLSFFGLPDLPRLAPPHVAPGNNLKIAALLDLAGTKASVVQVRAEAKDYLDIEALLASGKIDLPAALAAGKAIYGKSFNPEITLKALSYYEDGNVKSLPEAAKKRLAEAVRAVDLDRLPVVEPLKRVKK
jgi:hypothetical protein